MSEAKWTKGPWTTDTSKHCWGHCAFEIVAPVRDIQPIALVSLDYRTSAQAMDENCADHRNATQRANAALIAAAPELYEACREALDGLVAHAIGASHQLGDKANEERNFREVKRIHEMLRSALLKARGEQ